MSVLNARHMKWYTYGTNAFGKKIQLNKIPIHENGQGSV